MRFLAAMLLCAGCLEAPPIGSPDGDGGGGDGGGDGETCGTAAALHDEFTGTELDRELWGGTGGVSAGDGEARIVSGAGVYNTLYSGNRYQVSGSQLVAELDVSQLANALMYLELDAVDQDARVGISLVNGELGLRVVDGGGDRTLDNAPLEQDHIWWRLREEAGQFFWATSSDGTNFSERGPFEASIGELARVEFELLPSSQAATLIVGAVNPDSSVPYCPAASFSDDFVGPSRRWSVDQQGDCQITVEDQAVLGYSEQAFCALTSRERFDLRDSSFSIELVEVGDCIPEPIMRIAIDYGDEVSLKCADRGGEKKLIAARNTAEVAEVPYEPDEHRFVRVRHDSELGNLYFEGSPGDGVWSRIGSMPLPAEPLAETTLRFYLGGITSGEFETVAFDSLNLAP